MTYNPKNLLLFQASPDNLHVLSLMYNDILSLTRKNIHDGSFVNTNILRPFHDSYLQILQHHGITPDYPATMKIPGLFETFYQQFFLPEIPVCIEVQAFGVNALDIQGISRIIATLLLAIFCARQVRFITRQVSENIAGGHFLQRLFTPEYYVSLRGNLIKFNKGIPRFPISSYYIIPFFNRISGCNLPLGAIASAKGISAVLLYVVNSIVALRINDPAFISQLNEIVNACSHYVTLDLDAPGLAFGWFSTIPQMSQYIVEILVTILINFGTTFPEFSTVIETTEILPPLTNLMLSAENIVDPSVILLFPPSIPYLPVGITVGQMLTDSFYINTALCMTPEVISLLERFSSPYSNELLLSSLDVSASHTNSIPSFSGLFGVKLSVSVLTHVISNPGVYIVGLSFFLIRHSIPVFDIVSSMNPV